MVPRAIRPLWMNCFFIQGGEWKYSNKYLTTSSRSSASTETIFFVNKYGRFMNNKSAGIIGRIILVILAFPLFIIWLKISLALKKY